MPKLSIIVPVYNVENYITRCIESILKQSCASFELILVDDGSSDQSGTICDKYAEKDQRIVVIHQTNSGVSTARNAGLSVATGTYIGFVDSDDWIEPEMYQEVIENMKRGHAELGFCNWNSIYEDGSVKKHPNDLPLLITKNEFLKRMFSISRTVSGAVWNKVFLRTKITERFDETIKVGEDWLFLCSYCTEIERVAFTNQNLYNVLERSESVMRSNIENEVLGVPVSRRLVEEMSNIDETVTYFAEAKHLDTCLRLLNMELSAKSICYIKDELKTYIRQNWKRIIRNKVIPWKSKIIYFQRGLFER